MYVWSKLSSKKWADAWEERFQANVATNMVITEIAGGKTIRVDVYCEKKKEANEIQKLFGGSIRELKNQNWAAMAPPAAEPIKIRNKMIVYPGGDKDRIAALKLEFPDRSVLSIPPALAFGTGDHATTATCLRLLSDIAEEHAKSGSKWSMLDAGCGTGILAIAAAKLGASPVEGFDFDPHAVKNAHANAKANKATKAVLFDERDVLIWMPARGERWDCICANLFSTILEQAFPTLVKALAPKGRLIISGILKDHAEGCLAAGEKIGLRFDKIVRKGKWVTAMASKA